ncbi:MAG: YeeE/YedE family protein [Flavobacteriaceae bacterium]|nr:YeeE/YedE family protein [Flavobacteriaceae bacterium]
MQNRLLLLIGIVFGITMYKSEAASWFRIYEMFQFESFHMYGVIGAALAVGVLGIQLIKRLKLKSFFGKPIILTDKEYGVKRYLYGGIFFGLGWAITGACPGPMFTLLGAGFYPILIVIAAATLGTWAYGLLRDKLPH